MGINQSARDRGKSAFYRETVSYGFLPAAFLPSAGKDNGMYLGENYKKLGFGFMRLPHIGEETDLEQVKKMVDLFMSKGFTYFDTAYVYDGGKSEEAMREALVKRYPRESFTIATKLPLWNVGTSFDDFRKLTDTSLERLGVDYVDFYLVHNINNTKDFDLDRDDEH